MLMKQLSSLQCLLRQGLALRAHDENECNLMQLLMVHSEDCDGLKAWLEGKKHLSHEIVNEMIRLMNNLHFSNRLFSEVYKFLRILLSVPITTATVSVLRHLKTFYYMCTRKELPHPTATV